MSLTLVWSLIGVGFAVAVAVMIRRVDATGLGPNGSRLTALGLAVLAYYGALSLWKLAPHLRNPVHYPLLRYGVPVAAALAALYLLWQLRRDWRAELRGLLSFVLRLALIVVGAFLARFFLSL